MHIPQATYRIQFNPSFTFPDAEKIVSYLYDLGISHIYASPIFTPTTGSPHGYDVVDPTQINPQLGAQEGFIRLIQKLKEKNIGWLQDIVPNHMAYNKENMMLMDVFQEREHSRFYGFFDIDWVHPYENFQGRVLAPFLGKFYSEALESGEIQLVYDERGLRVKYYELEFPLLLSTYEQVFLYDEDLLESRIGENNPLAIQFYGLIDMFKEASSHSDQKRYDYIGHAKKMLWDFIQSHPDIKDCIDENINFFNRGKENEVSLTVMDELLSKQCFRLSFWRVASEELNYRRFFTVNELISLRVEKEEVFRYTHQLILKLIQEGKIQGVRVDHIDGLYNPNAYLDRLRGEIKDIYTVVEKILALDESLPGHWDIQGTTGYDFMNCVNGLFCEQKNAKNLLKLYYKFSDLRISYEQLVSEKKRLIIGKHMAGDIDNLAYLMKKVAGRHRYGRDISLYGLKRALVEVVACFSVYRTYIDEEHFSSQDEQYMSKAIEKARCNAPALEYELSFIENFLLLRLIDSLTEEEKKDFWHFIKRFQQMTAPIMAKGFEDTTFYTYHKLISLNEVGGEPNRTGTTIEDFHRFNAQHQASFPHSMNASATHDTKRGEDVRARINVLSELFAEWKSYLHAWSKINRGKKRKIDGECMPDANDEYFIYQTLLGSYPYTMENMAEYPQRIKDYIVKAAREAKVHSAWVKPDKRYEDACMGFIDALLENSEANQFLPSFLGFQKIVAHYGMLNSLSQTTLKMTSPGMPDFYQGSELWELSLVDPDNRREVDFSKRKNYLDEIKTKSESDLLGLIGELRSDVKDGKIKLFLICQVLNLRRRQSQLFEKGDYIPLRVEGKYKECIVSFARRLENDWAVVVVPRFSGRLVQCCEWPLGVNLWGDTAIFLPDEAPQKMYDCITRKECSRQPSLPVGDLLEHFPAAVLVNVLL